MKLLLDQNLSFRLIKQLNHLYPGIQQVRILGLENASDRVIWEYARKNGYAIITFDADFNDLATLFGHPPKIIWLRLGNTSSMHLIQILTNIKDLIIDILSNPTYQDIACLEIS